PAISNRRQLRRRCRYCRDASAVASRASALASRATQRLAAWFRKRAQGARRIQDRSSLVGRDTRSSCGHESTRATDDGRLQGRAFTSEPESESEADDRLGKRQATSYLTTCDRRTRSLRTYRLRPRPCWTACTCSAAPALYRRGVRPSRRDRRARRRTVRAHCRL